MTVVGDHAVAEHGKDLEVQTRTIVEDEVHNQWKPTWRFGMVIMSLSTAGFLTSLENTITGTAMPTIVADLNGADSYVWIANAYTLTM